MVPDLPALPRATALTGVSLQVTLAAVVLLAPLTTTRPTFGHYALAILVSPALVRFVAGRTLTVPQRTWVSVGLALHPLGVLYDWYLTVWWFDHLTHFLSATLVVGGGVLFVRSRWPTITVSSPNRAMACLTLVLVLAAGLSWEVFELYAPNLIVFGPADTVADLVFDLLGWAVAIRFEQHLVGPPRRDSPAPSTDSGAADGGIPV